MDDHQAVILPYTSLFLVDRSWNCPQKSTKKAQSTGLQVSHEASMQSGTVKAITQPWVTQNTSEEGSSEKACTQQPRVSSTTRTFKFINTTQPGQPQDPKVRTLIKRHVKTGLKQGQNSNSARKRKSLATLQPKTDADFNDFVTSSSLGMNSPAFEQPSPFISAPRASSPFYSNPSFDIVTGPRSESLLDFCICTSIPESLCFT